LCSLADEVKILTWNVYMLPKPIKFSKQSERVPIIAKELLKSDYDVIFLQEAFQTSFRKNVSKMLLPKYPHQNYLRKSRKLLAIMNSGLYVASKHPFKVLGHEYFNKCTHADCFASKGVLLVELTTTGDKKVQIAMTHMQAHRDPKAIRIRRDQLDEIKGLLKKFYKPGVPQLLVGDLNIDGNRDVEFPDALASIEMTSTPLEGDLTDTSGINAECLKKESRTPKMKWLDHVWIKRNGSNSEVVQKKVKPFIAYIKSSKKECSLSDHYAVEAILKL
jgi:endonuclease/exonuclease/phosphatase family metal-dependent hydrolase